MVNKVNSVPSSEKKRIALGILAILQKRGDPKSICPSEVARALYPENWRDAMPWVREVGVTLRNEGKIQITQKGEVIHGNTWKGPIRFKSS